MINKIVLTDRDGTLIKEPYGDRLIRIEDIEIYDDTIEALRILHQNGYSLIIITNQQGASEKLVEFQGTHQHVLDLLKPSGIEIIKTYVCPHGPQDNCECRKPKTKMFEDAARDLGFNLKDVFMVGDRQTDIEAANKIGAKSIFLNTGLQTIKPGLADFEVNNMLQAASIIIHNSLK